MKTGNSLTKTTAKVPFSVAVNSINCQARKARFITAIISAVTNSPQLQNCTPGSIVSAALQGEALDLSPSPALGHYYLVPYGDKANFQLGVNGMKQLAMRSGEYQTIVSNEVREGEYIGKDAKTGEPQFVFISDDDVRESLPVIGYMAYFRLRNGFEKTIYFSKEKMLKWADRYSQAFSSETYKEYEEARSKGAIPQNLQRACSSPWYENFDLMGEKTVMRQLLSKNGILSIDMVRAVEADIRGENGETEEDVVTMAEPVAEAKEAEEKTEDNPVESFFE